MTFEEHCACDILADARDYLARKSYNGDQGGEYMNYWEWNVVTCSAIGILDDAHNQIHWEALCTTQK